MAMIQEEDDTAWAWKTKWIVLQEAYIKECEGHADALYGWNVAEEGRDLEVMAAEAATSRALTGEERILELRDLVASLKARLRTEEVRVEKVRSLAERLVAAGNRLELLEAELQAKVEEVSMSEATCLVSHTALEEVERKLEVRNKELHDKKVEAQELRRENTELKVTRRTRMVDKGVGSLPRPQVYSVPVQTDTATVGVGVAVPKFVSGVPQTWAERAAMVLPGGGGGVVHPPPTVGAAEVEMKDVSGTSSGGVKGRKWSFEVTNAYSLGIHGVSWNQGVAALWSQASRLRVGAGKTVVGLRWLLS